MENFILQIFMGPCNVFIYTVYIYIINGFQFAKVLVTLIRFLKVLALAADFSRVPNGMVRNITFNLILCQVTYASSTDTRRP